jgi:hypothetical protein
MVVRCVCSYMYILVFQVFKIYNYVNISKAVIQDMLVTVLVLLLLILIVTIWKYTLSEIVLLKNHTTHQISEKSFRRGETRNLKVILIKIITFGKILLKIIYSYVSIF